MAEPPLSVGAQSVESQVLISWVRAQASGFKLKDDLAPEVAQGIYFR